MKMKRTPIAMTIALKRSRISHLAVRDWIKNRIKEFPIKGQKIDKS
jgi:hypothetical protein